MAETLHLNDGTVEVITGTPKESLLRLIEERLGWDCARLFEKLTERVDVDRDEWECIADGYSALCHETVEELEGLVQKIDRQRKRMTKEDIRNEVNGIREHLWSNL
jgi:hypothetical protein